MRCGDRRRCDSLCRLTVNGFLSLEAVSDNPCQPFSRHRDGINLGEAAALFVVTPESGGVQLAGVGESVDAHHISAPRPDGSGAAEAMRQALAMAGLDASEIDYLNLHGTGTALNDSMEAAAVTTLFPSPPACSSTKGLTGHTLGAAGPWKPLSAGWHSPRDGYRNIVSTAPTIRSFLRSPW